MTPGSESYVERTEIKVIESKAGRLGAIFY